MLCCATSSGSSNGGPPYGVAILHRKGHDGIEEQEEEDGGKINELLLVDQPDARGSNRKHDLAGFLFLIWWTGED